MPHHRGVEQIQLLTNRSFFIIYIHLCFVINDFILWQINFNMFSAATTVCVQCMNMDTFHMQLYSIKIHLVEKHNLKSVLLDWTYNIIDILF